MIVTIDDVAGVILVALLIRVSGEALNCHATTDIGKYSVAHCRNKQRKADSICEKPGCQQKGARKQDHGAMG